MFIFASLTISDIGQDTISNSVADYDAIGSRHHKETVSLLHHNGRYHKLTHLLGFAVFFFEIIQTHIVGLGVQFLKDKTR